MSDLSLPRRLALLQGAIVLALLVGMASVRHWQGQQVQMLFRERVDEVGNSLDRIANLQARSFELHVSDYSRWDEFVRMLRTHDREWADANLDAGTRVFSVDVVWALDTLARGVYAARHVDGPLAASPPMDRESLLSHLRRRPFRHFFVRTTDGVIETWTAPVQPTRDVARVTRPVGYYVIGRYLSPTVLGELSRQAGGFASLTYASMPGEAERGSVETGRIFIDRTLRGLDGEPVARLRFHTDYPLLLTLQDNVRQLMVITGLGAVLALLIVALLVSRWFAVPLEKIRVGLEAESAGPLAGLAARRDEFGRIARLMAEFFGQRAALVREVRTRQQAERESELRARHIRAVIDADPNVVYVVDRDGRIVLANHGAEALFAAVADVAPGSDMAPVLAALGWNADLHATDATAAAVRGSEADVAGCEAIRLADGTLRYYRTLRRRLPGPEDEGQVLTVSVDVTHHFEHEEQLREARDAAEAGAHAKSQFLANVSHELRTPMHGILSYAKFGLRESGTASPDELRGYFENIRDCGETLLELLNDLLDLAKFEAGRMQFRFDELDLGDVVGTVVNEFDSLLDERGIHVAVECTSALPLVSADRIRVLQVLRNLLSNAAKFSESGSHIVVRGEPGERHVRLYVDDEGSGLPESELEAIFDPFVQASTNLSPSGGTGLGLAICREIVGAHGGRIWAENRPTGGTRVVIELPVPIAGAREDDADERPPLAA